MEKDNSIWKDSIENTREFRTLKENLTVDVCVIGGGITGISTAYYLSKAGMNVAVFEKDRIASKTTGKTTGKITSQHHLFYQYLIDSKGKDFAKKYYQSNQEAIENIEKIIKEENIDCDFERKSALVFTKDLKNLHRINTELNAMENIKGKAKFTNEIEVLGKIEGAIEFPNQALFNPVKYAYGLVDCILKNGGEIFENSKVVEYEKDEEKFIITVEADGVYRNIFAKYVVVATRYPIFNTPGFHFIKMYQELEYGMALKSDVKLNGMYVSVETPTISFREYNSGKENYILVVGNGHKTGEKTSENRFQYLENFAKEYFPGCEIEYQWTAEDAIGLDKIPYIGEFSELMKNMYVATGFKKWGMTSSNIAANMITEMITKGKSKYEDIFKSTRLEPIKNREEMGNILKEARESLIMPRLKMEKGEKYCVHLGCKLTWNDVSKTWDCPCHGSRYEQNGKLIEGPSVHDLQ